MVISRKVLGRIEGRSVHAFLLDDQQGLRAKVVEYGATLAELHLLDGRGRSTDIVLGFDTLDGYLSSKSYFGATVGRYANRIKNGSFRLGGTVHNLSRNEAANHLHGGHRGFDKVLWRGQVNERNDGARFFHASADGSEGYPGELEVEVEYRLPGRGRLTIEFTAKTSSPTILNLVNHSYFNLAGHSSGDVLKQVIMLNADCYTPVDDELIPTGAIASVRNTPYDFRAPKAIGRDAHEVLGGSGYDHNWVLRGDGLRLCARSVDPVSGRSLELWTTEPGVQFYIGGQLGGSHVGKGGHSYGRFAGFTLETQKFPDSPNHPNFPSTRLMPGETYRHVMEFRFATGEPASR